MVKLHSTVGLITNSSTVIFTEGAFDSAACGIQLALHQLLMVVGSNVSVEEVLDLDKLRAALENGLNEKGVGGKYEDNELGTLLEIMNYGDWTRYG